MSVLTHLEVQRMRWQHWIQGFPPTPPVCRKTSLSSYIPYIKVRTLVPWITAKDSIFLPVKNVRIQLLNDTNPLWNPCSQRGLWEVCGKWSHLYKWLPPPTPWCDMVWSQILQFWPREKHPDLPIQPLLAPVFPHPLFPLAHPGAAIGMIRDQEMTHSYPFQTPGWGISNQSQNGPNMSWHKNTRTQIYTDRCYDIYICTFHA